MFMPMKDVLTAAVRLAGKVHTTPVVRSRQLDELTGARLFLKCENLQRIGAFKIRGATNAVLALDLESAGRGVLTHSSGNHGQALALAARERGIPCTVVMPRNSAAVKKAAVEGYGARVVESAPGSAAREALTAQLAAETGATVIHPYDHRDVIAGQGTAALELLAAHPEIEILIAPIGGGGLLAGSALAAEAVFNGANASSASTHPVLVYGAEPETADDAAQSLAAGRIVTRNDNATIADGLRTAAVGHLVFPILQRRVEAILTVSEAEIVRAMRFVWERLKLVIEPSSAVAVAAVLRHRELFQGRAVGVILTGGNVDLDRLPWL